MVVFRQQIGRGLRKADGKHKCVIIDLIGNYRTADTKVQVFQDQSVQQNEREIVSIIPATCEIHLETKVIDLLEALRTNRSPRKERIYNDYISIKETLGR